MSHGKERTNIPKSDDNLKLKRQKLKRSGNVDESTGENLKRKRPQLERSGNVVAATNESPNDDIIYLGPAKPPSDNLDIKTLKYNDVPNDTYEIKDSTTPLKGDTIETYLTTLNTDKCKVEVMCSKTLEDIFNGRTDIYERKELTGYKYICGPIIVPDGIFNHWVLFLVDVEESNVYFIDSNEEVPKKNYNLEDKFSKWCEFSKEKDVFKLKEWKFYTCKKNIQKLDAYSCGVYVCWFAKQIIEKRNKNEEVNIEKLEDDARKLNLLEFRKQISDSISQIKKPK